MKIIEWRSTAAFLAETTPSDSALALIDGACRDAFRRYSDFLRSKKLPQLRKIPNVLPAISLLPGNTLVDGKTSRALNDLPSRFGAVAPGCCYWGLYVDSLEHLFLRNDPLAKNEAGALVPNLQFVRTLTHEISHVLSTHLGVWDLVGYDRQRDERLAEDFVAYMGMHFPTTDSADDLAFHRGRPARGSPRTEPAPTAGGPSRAPQDPTASWSTYTRQGAGGARGKHDGSAADEALVGDAARDVSRLTPLP